jgi:hypothetical protein
MSKKARTEILNNILEAQKLIEDKVKEWFCNNFIQNITNDW